MEIKMQKKEITAILSKASKCDVCELADKIAKTEKIEVLKEPEKTLVMVKVREPIKRSLFYLGEVLASECMVKVNGEKGCSVLAGDDFDKVLAAAIIDGALNAGMNETFSIEEYLNTWKKKQEKERAHLNAEILKSKVDFNVMG
jgi:alpha-D-ribose 1-methylphosphonate 5-triphosphate synthase subunit PhnG